RLRRASVGAGSARRQLAHRQRDAVWIEPRELPCIAGYAVDIELQQPQLSAIAARRNDPATLGIEPWRRKARCNGLGFTDVEKGRAPYVETTFFQRAERARIRMRGAAHQVMHLERRPAPIDAAVGRSAGAEVGALTQVLRRL